MKNLILFVVLICATPTFTQVAPIVFDFQFPTLGPWNVNCNSFGGTCNLPDKWHTGEDVPALAGTAVLAPAAGVVKHTNNRAGYGNVIIIEHYLSNQEYVCSVNGHLRGYDMKVTVGQVVSRGDTLGFLGSQAENGGWPPHFHLGINRGQYKGDYEPGCSSNPGEWWYSGYTKCQSYLDNWYNPSEFINARQAGVGYYSDGWRSDGTSQATLDRFIQSGNVGHPLGLSSDNGPFGYYVHTQSGVTLQDFLGDNTNFYHGYTAIILNPSGVAAHLLKEGFWRVYMERINGLSSMGAASTDEYVYAGYTKQDFQYGYMTFDQFGNSKVRVYDNQDNLLYVENGFFIAAAHQIGGSTGFYSFTSTPTNAHTLIFEESVSGPLVYDGYTPTGAIELSLGYYFAVFSTSSNQSNHLFTINGGEDESVHINVGSGSGKPVQTFNITSEPSGASLYITDLEGWSNNTTTPLIDYLVGAYLLRFELSMGGYTSWDTTITLVHGATTNLHKVLEPVGNPIPNGEKIVVTQPNGGESYGYRDFVDVTWQQDPSITAVRVEYSANGGQSWTLAGFVYGGTAKSFRNMQMSEKTECLVRVKNRYNYDEYDLSDDYFSLEGLNRFPKVGDEGEELTQIPDNYSLFQNHPNPFNPTTIIKYDLPQASQVKIVIYDLLGREIRELVNGYQEAGHQQVVWDSQNNQGIQVTSGVYLYRMSASQFIQTNKLILLK